MKNEGFLGAVVVIDRVVIEAGPGGIPVATVSVQFTADEGTVHAVATHQFVLDQEQGGDPVTAAARALTQALTARVEALHFKTPAAQGATHAVLRGIAETLREPTQNNDEPGTPA